MQMTNNAAGRLYRILSEAKRRSALDTNNRVIALEVWSSILDIPTADTPRLMRSIGYVRGLPDTIKCLIEKHETNPDRYLSWHPKVSSRFANNLLNLGAPIRNVVGDIDDNEMSLIAICEDRISGYGNDKWISNDKYNQLLADTRKLAADLAAASGDSIPVALRQYLMRHIELIEAALCDYRVIGFDALQHGIEQSIGAVACNRSMANEMSESHYGKRFITILGVVMFTVVNNYANVKLITTDAIKMLPALSRAHDEVDGSDTEQPTMSGDCADDSDDDQETKTD